MSQVQSGGSFDVDYTVEGPGSRIILEGEKERQGDFVFTAQHVGEYSFCLDNEMSTFTDKLVDFEISVSWLSGLVASAGAWLIMYATERARDAIRAASFQAGHLA